LTKFRRIEFADWANEADARALAGSPFLTNLERLTLWLGGRHENAVLRTFARGVGTPHLKEIRLIQLYGGLAAGARAKRLDFQAKRQAEFINGQYGRKVAHVYRPFQQSFPIRGDTGRSLYAGRLPDQRQALAALWAGHTLLLLIFDAEGHLIEVQRRPQLDFLPREYERLFWQVVEEDLYGFLRKEFGFALDLIRVKEFAIPEGVSVYYWPSTYDEYVANPDNLPDGVSEEDRAGPTFRIHQWMARGDFVIEWGNDYWAGPDGIIHSS
jgi:hypothetical protein